MSTRVIIQPIKPSEVVDKKQALIPDEVLEAFNNLIAQKWNGVSATLRQDDVVALIITLFLKSGKEYTKADIHKNNWLDIEDVYRKVGWNVYYDKPCYNESFEPTFTFKHKVKC